MRREPLLDAGCGDHTPRRTNRPWASTEVGRQYKNPYPVRMTGQPRLMRLRLRSIPGGFGMRRLVRIGLAIGIVALTQAPLSVGATPPTRFSTQAIEGTF